MDEQVSRLTISIKGQKDWVLENDDVWEEFARDFLKEEDFLKKNRNLAASKYAFILAPSPSARPWILLVTPQYGSDPGNLFVLALDSAGRPEIILKETLHIKEFRDLDGDGIAEIAGQPCFSQSWSDNLLTYDPLHVYKLESHAQAEAEAFIAAEPGLQRETLLRLGRGRVQRGPGGGAASSGRRQAGHHENGRS